jgi:predicted lipoprotein
VRFERDCRLLAGAFVEVAVAAENERAAVGALSVSLGVRIRGSVVVARASCSRGR